MSRDIPFVWGNYNPAEKQERVFLGSVNRVSEPPPLLENQKKSFEWFKEEGISKLFDLVNPITDPTGEMWEVHFEDFRFGEPNRTVEESKLKDMSYDAPLYSTVRLKNKKTKVERKREIFMMDIPVMTDEGTFIYNGVSRAVIHQIIRAEGVTFLESKYSSSERPLYMAKLRPKRGSWIQFIVNKEGAIFVKLMRGNVRIPVTMILKALGFGNNKDIIKEFSEVNTGDTNYLDACFKYDPTSSQEEAALAIYKMIRSEQTVATKTAIRYVKGLFFDDRKFFLGRVGRYQMCRKFEEKMVDKKSEYKLKVDDIVNIVRRLIRINNGELKPDDVDALTNRRLRSVGELLVDQLESGVIRMERNVRDRLSRYGKDKRVTPRMVVNAKPLKGAVNRFFGLNSLSRFLDQESVLAQLECTRRISAGGPGGVPKERASFSMRDIHFSQYGRICPAKTPEKLNIGVVIHLALYSRVNDYGFIESMYRKVRHEVEVGKDNLVNKIPLDTIKDGRKHLVKAGEYITKEDAKVIKKKLKGEKIAVKPYFTKEIDWIDPHEELELTTTVSTVDQDEHGNILAEYVPARSKGEFARTKADLVDYVDICPSQIGSVSLTLIPFVGNTDSTRMLIGSNQTNQAVPLARTEVPIIGTGFEEFVARETNTALYSPVKGTVKYVDSKKIIIEDKDGEEIEKQLTRYKQSNQNMAFSQTPRVSKGDKVKKGDLLADGPGMFNGELALGKNLLVAYMFYEGYNYEDGFVISERLVKDDTLTSLHIYTYDVEIRDTKLGPEEITKDIPGVPEETLSNLGGNGIVRVGASVESGDILVGVVGPKGEHELSAEEKLLRAIFGEPSREVTDSSLRLPHGEKGIVIRTHTLSKEKGDKVDAGVLKVVKVWVASAKQIDFGDKLSGRYGDKGTVAKIVPEEDMPYLEDGTPIDMICNPLVIKRMNLGQLFETYYSNIAFSEGVNLAIPNFEDLDEEWIDEVKEKHDLPETAKTTLYDGRTGEAFDKKVAVGWRYFLKLKHLAGGKIHARSTGPYTQVSQQPLAGRAHRGGQRFGEMEVWGLEAHGAAHVLQEMLTIKSDDVEGRSKAYKSILNGEPIEVVKTPESFKVLIRELNSLKLKVDLFQKEEE